MFNPVIVEKVGKSVHNFDVDTKLYQNRIVYLTGEINGDRAKEVITQLLYLDSVDTADINLYINSEGGSVTDGLAIADTMQILKSNINTTGIGLCASMGAILLVSGTGERRCTKNCQILLHTVSSYTGYSDVHQSRADMDHQELLNNVLFDIICSKSDMQKEELERITQHDCWLTAEQALEYKIVDRILE